MNQQDAFEITIKSESTIGDVKEIMENIEELGGIIVEQIPELNTMEVRLPRGKINDLNCSHIQNLQYVDE
ncbi:uncharacterized protein J8A68_005689 [[Candida] subhashii]|uniref:Uncharacterized protein n=1 Tax=[Candida] subhashii TaxID=561895 RepID=A0A8J5QFD7_9ASCO|nr:uncharacterized protein J8A68_005689 [[Candida] subhashii]KAG7660727.1 hypothetical protein J8A68_005689 [[Candida] subhashii]